MMDAIDARLEAWLGREGIRRLHASQVAAIGLGLLGGQHTHQLAMLQIPTVLVDAGAVDLPNLGNQMLPADSLGEPKARVRARQMRELNPSCAVRAVAARLEDVGLGVFADCDLLLTGLDGRASRVAVSRIACALGIDWIDAAVDGSGQRLFGTVSWYRPHREDGPCYACHLDGARLAAIAAERGAGCASWRSVELPDTPPTLTAAPFGAVVAGLQIVWALQALLGRGEELAGRQLQIAGGGTPRIRSVVLPKGARCAFPHRSLGALPRLACRTLGELLEVAERDLGAAPDAVLFPGRQLAHGIVCPSCGAARPLVKRREAVGADEVHCDCGAPGEMAPRALVDRLGIEDARRLAALDWKALGLPAEDLVAVRGPGREPLHYLLPREEEETWRAA